MGKQASLGPAIDALGSLLAGLPSPKQRARRRVATPVRKPEGMPSLAIDRVAELLIQRKALMAVVMRVDQTTDAMGALMDRIFDTDQELGAASLSSAEGAVAALRFIQDQYLGDRHNEPLAKVDATVVHLLAELGEFVRIHERRVVPVADMDDLDGEIPF